MGDKKNEAKIQEIMGILLAAGPMFAGADLPQTRRLAQEWDACGFTPGGVGNWVGAGYWSPAAAAAACEAGHSYRDHPQYVGGDPRANVEPIHALCSGDVSVDDLTWGD